MIACPWVKACPPGLAAMVSVSPTISGEHFYHPFPLQPMLLDIKIRTVLAPFKLLLFHGVSERDWDYMNVFRGECQFPIALWTLPSFVFQVRCSESFSLLYRSQGLGCLQFIPLREMSVSWDLSQLCATLLGVAGDCPWRVKSWELLGVMQSLRHVPKLPVPPPWRIYYP